MNTRFGLWRSFGFVLILFTILSCGSLGSIQPTKTPVPLGKGNGNTIGASGGAGSEDSNNNPNPQNPISISTLQVTETPQPTPTESDEFSPGPYTVKQTETLGKETLGTPLGGVCIYRPWQVPVDTPQVSFAFVLGPYPLQPVKAGSSTFGYAYQIPSAGESHQSQGTYTLSGNKDGSLKVSIRYSDHVVFKGFDGNIPGRYQFALVPIGGTNTACQ